MRIGPTNRYSIGRGRARFKRELARLSRLQYGAIVIEAPLADFLHAPAFSRMSPRTAVNSMLAWSVKYRIPIFFACDRRHGNALTRQLLRKCWRYRQTPHETDAK